ncbi:MAG: sigma-70 family RNA polymerase sigma factor [Planctomycetes bacterium]|nr:sigma-70 family RNA polymerase sigma factor [Planctomycetota bacterium]
MPEENQNDGGEAPQEERRAPASFELPEEFLNDETAKLVQAAQTGDAEALNQLFTRYHQIMIDVARRQLGPKLRLKEDPDDLAQTTFREATRDFNRYQYRGERSLLGWLVQILKNKIRDKAEFYNATKRDQGRERSMEVGREGDERSTLEFPSSDLSVTQIVSRDENAGLLRAALEDLSEEHRKAITLVFFEGLSLREAGKRLNGRTEDAVRMMLRRAEDKLGERLRGTLGKDIS